MMQTLTVRPIQPVDADAILTINRAGRPGVYPLTPAIIAEVSASAPYVVVAELDGQVVGYMIGYTAHDVCEGDEFAWFQAHLPQFLYIDQVAVAPAARRAGVGAQLYTHATAFARARDIPAIVCEVNLDPPNPVSLQFHERLGFREVGILTAHDGRTVSLRQKGIQARAVDTASS